MASFSLRDSSALLTERLVEVRVPPEVLSVCLSLTAQGKDVQGPSSLHVPHPIRVYIPPPGVGWQKGTRSSKPHLLRTQP